jgi:ribonuclease HII
VGHASSAEIDAVGIIQALRTAALRAIAALSITPDLVLLDGNHDYLRAPVQDSLFALDSAPAFDIPVTTMVKGDMRCAGVAAASILAKTARDALMLELAAAYPEFGWAENKGYSAPEHLSALARFGPTPHHRLSWNLPTSRDEAAAFGESPASGANPVGPAI